MLNARYHKRISDSIAFMGAGMPAVTIRNLTAETHRALRVRAAAHGRSTEAEIRDILETAARPEGRVKLGSLLAAIGRDAGLTDEDVEALQRLRDQTPAAPMNFE
jgi:plasmid stability protein